MKIKITEEGQACRKCGVPVEKRTHDKPPKFKAGGYYFEYWMHCPGCGEDYMVEAAKKYFESPAELF